MPYLLSNLSIILVCSMFMSGCQSTHVVKPVTYQTPDIQSADRYKYSDLNWIAIPKNQTNQQEWWKVYNDPVLSEILQQLNLNNLTLQQAEARYRYAMALVNEQKNNRRPTINLKAEANRSASKEERIHNQLSTGINVSWAPDLWGRVAKALEGQQANLKASQADLAAIQLNQQLLASDAYLMIRLLDLKLDMLRETQKSDQRSVQILQHQNKAGMIARADVIQAETQLKQIEIELNITQRERALQENILAVLLGKTITSFQLQKVVYTYYVPKIPMQIPSRILSQRPDVIRAERELAAIHAQLGLAETAWLPDINIDIDTALNSQALSSLLQSPHYLWSMGLKMTSSLFDGGKRQVDIEKAKANYEEKIAAYKQTVLTGWKEVEDALLQSVSLNQQTVQQQQLLNLTTENERVAIQRYQAGMVTYLEVVIAQNVRLQANQVLLEAQNQEVKNSMQLIAALGTNW